MCVAIATGIALCLTAMPSTPARAASLSQQAHAADEDASADMRALYELGTTHYEAGEYDEAVILWKRAFVLIRRDDLAQQPIRGALVLNIVAAHQSAYENERNPEHLAEAMRVIDLRKNELVEFYSQDQVALKEMSDLNTKRVELADLHAAALRKGEVPSTLPVGTTFHIEPEPPPQLDSKQTEMILLADPELGGSYRKGKDMAASGMIIMLALGGGGALVAALTLAMSEPAFTRGDHYTNPIPIAIGFGSVAAGAFIIGGTLVGVGTKRKKQAREGYGTRQNLTGTLVPLSLPRGGGIGFVGRF